MAKMALQQMKVRAHFTHTLGGVLLSTAVLCCVTVILISIYSDDLGSWSRWYYIGVVAFAVISVTPFGPPLGGLIFWAMIIGAFVLGLPLFAVAVGVAWGIIGWIYTP
jgi:hypothetical protein